MKTIFRLVGCAVAVFALIGAAYAQFAKPEEAIAYRKAVMKVNGHHFNSLGAMVKGTTPYDQAAVASDAQVVTMMAGLPWAAFAVAGSDQGDTRLKSSALKENDKFMAAASAFEAASEALGEVAGSGDEGAVKAQFGVVAQTCKGCHGVFRK
ncbi:MAG: cytochrome c [Desulfobacterales bacterium]